ncbi:MAG: leucine-rich repeat domain-containing protein [Rubripirellula sp.]
MFPILPPIEIPDDTEFKLDSVPEATALSRSALKLVAQSKHPHWLANDRSLLGRWNRTSRRYLWGLDRWKPAVDRLREGARLSGVVYSPATSERAFSKAAALQNFAWLIRLVELNARRMYSARRADWSAEMLLDGIRAAGDLRKHADSEQLQLSIESELHLMRELRSLASRRRVTPDLADRTFESADTILRDPLDRPPLWTETYDRKTETRFQIDVAESLPEKERLRRAIYASLIETGKVGSCRDLFRVAGTQVSFRFPETFSREHKLPDSEQWSSLIDNHVQAEIVALFQASQRMDTRDVAAGATIAHLCLFAHYRRLGFYPASLPSGFHQYRSEVPVDSFAKPNRILQLRLAGGERLRGLGVDNWRGSLRTKSNQPLVYSVGPDREDDRASITWDGNLQGGGDWIFPLPPHRRPRHLLQFDLRKALIAMTLIGLMLAYLTSGPARQRRVIQRIDANGGSVGFRTVSSGNWQGFFRNWLGDERFGTIESVDLGQSARVGYLLQAMSGLHDLSEMSLSSCTVGDGDFVHLRHFPKLQTLWLDSASIPPKEYANLSGLHQLVTLSCSDTAINDKGIAQIPKLPSLRSFTLSSTDVTGESFDKLAERFPNLTELVLYDTKCTDEAMRQVGKLRRLEYLDVDGTNITNLGVAHLSDLTNLQTLDLQRTAISDPAIKSLSKMTKLSELRLNETQVDGSGLIHLQKLPKLETLTMDGTRLTDQQIPILVKLTRLRSLSIDATRVSPVGTAALSQLQASVMYPQWAGGWNSNQGVLTAPATSIPGTRSAAGTPPSPSTPTDSGAANSDTADSAAAKPEPIPESTNETSKLSPADSNSEDPSSQKEAANTPIPETDHQESGTQSNR